MDSTIWNAASMFIASPTGRSQRGTGHQRSLAKRVVQALKHEIHEGDIKFSNNVPHNALGNARLTESSGNIVITLKSSLKNDMAATSLMLVHEALHHHTIDHHPITEELDARRLSILYFQDLIRTSWMYKTKDGKMTSSIKLQRKSSTDKKLNMSLQESCDKHKQLIDFVFYADYGRLVDTEWVRRNLDYWGGLENRWPEIRGFYVRALAKRGTIGDARGIKRVLESLLKSHHPAPGYKEEFAYVANMARKQAFVMGLTSKGPMAGVSGPWHGITGSWKLVRRGLKPLKVNQYHWSDLKRLESSLDVSLTEEKDLMYYDPLKNPLGLKSIKSEYHWSEIAINSGSSKQPILGL